MDVSWHDDLIDGIDKPMIKDGMMAVPEGPGTGYNSERRTVCCDGEERGHGYNNYE